MESEFCTDCKQPIAPNHGNWCENGGVLLKKALALRKERKIKEASEALEQAAATDPFAQWELGDALRLGGYGRPKNLDAAFKMMKKAADNQCPPAMAVLARMYREGSGCEKDEEKSLEYGKRALETKHDYATGYCHVNGLGGVAKKEKESYPYFLRYAQEHGNAQAMCLLGYLEEKAGKPMVNCKSILYILYILSILCICLSLVFTLL